MVFLIQNTQNRDTAAIQLKLDELIRVNEQARNRMLSLEDLSEDELKQLKENFTLLVPADAELKPIGGAQEGLAGRPDRAIEKVTEIPRPRTDAADTA